MKQIETRITDLLLSPIAGLTGMIVGIAMLLSATGLIPESGLEADGVISGCGTVMASSTLAAILVAVFGGLVSISILSLTNRTFDIMQTTSNLYVGLFALLIASIPGALGMELDGILLLVTMMVCLMIMFTTYGRNLPYRRLFLIFVLLSAGSAMQYAFAFFIPAMLIGCHQMRCLTVKALLAALIGIITPYWILWGFGIITIDQFQPPHIGWPTPDSFSIYTLPQLIGSAGMAAIALTATIINIVKVYAQNARARAFNGILALVTIWTIAAAILDLGHLLTYVGLLAALTATQTTLFCQLNESRRSYILVLLTIALALSVFTWNLIGNSTL